MYANETSNIEDFGRENIPTSDVRVSWDDPKLAWITRLRLVTDAGFAFWDVSYCYGRLADGTACHVVLPFYQIPKNNVNGFIVNSAKAAGVFAKNLGLFDAGVISKIW